MGSISAMDFGALEKIASSLTPEQIAQTQWNIENTGRITMHNFKVSELEAMRHRRSTHMGYTDSFGRSLWARRPVLLWSHIHPPVLAAASLP